jgi:arylformamidase
MAVWAERSALTRRARPPRVHRYGPGEDETLDLFPGAPGGPLHLHFHGGAWRLGSKAESSFLAPALGAEGAHVAIADFSLAPAARLPAIVDQARRAARWARRAAAELGAADAPIHVSGHSSGAHLAAMLLDARWPEGAGLVASALLVSGVYDLQPVRASARNDYLFLDAATAEALSPVVRPRPTPAAVFCAAQDLDEFRRQSALFAAASRAAGAPVLERVLTELDHFRIYDAMGEPDSAIARTARALMRAADPGDVPD